MKTYGNGGGWQPYNSLVSFDKAKQEKLDGVFLEVWFTVDEQLVVLNAGPNGEIMSANESKGNVYSENFDDIKDNVPMACLLDQVLYNFKGTETKVMIEVKKTKDEGEYMEVDAM